MAPADLGLGIGLGLGCGFAFGQLDLIDTRPQHVPGLGPVLVLGALILTLHHDRAFLARHVVSQPHSAVRCVDVLTTGTGGPIGVRADSALLDFDIDLVVDQRISAHTGKTGMPAGT